ncbi:MAG: exported protein of unknown function [Candidatus Saccharibacteria bacterium]|nr:exported protein of unknown function [Candidatus Saccharibacteria bacterium]
MEITMSKLTSLIRRAPKRFSAVVAIIAAAIIVPVAVHAYGPERATFTYASPAPYVTFNSITDNPKVGDERSFVRVKEDSASTTYGKDVTLQPGKTYDVEVYYHNNAASNLNASGVGIAKDVSLRMQMPASIAASASDTVDGFINSSNANPTSVWDSANLKNGSTGAVALRYVPNSAVVTSNGAVNGAHLPDAFLTTGTPLGYDALNGTLPGCNQYAGYVTYKFTVVQPNFTVEKTVSVDGGKTYTKSGTTTPGATVIYKVAYTNTGSTQQDNVTLSDKLPAGVTYVAGSSLIENSKTAGAYQKTSDGITTTGLNIGSYAPAGGNAFFKFSATAPADAALKCGVNTFTNTARATTSGGYKESTADITINKTCAPGTINVCQLSTKTIVNIKESDFDSSKYSKNLDDCKTPPVTPPELPHTGMSENIVAIVGLGALIASIAYYVASRRALNQ